MNAVTTTDSPADTMSALLEQYRSVRTTTSALCESLVPEDFVVQSMPDVSPTKWHLAHTTWFFENFILQRQVGAYRCFNDEFDYLFNSYYYTVGQMHPRPQRGLLSRPSVADIMAYRQYVDEHMCRLLDNRREDAALESLVTLGLNHEQQHQELLLTDIKHVFSLNPLKPAWRELPAVKPAETIPLKYHQYDPALIEIGHRGSGFCFDNEMPRHQTFMQRHALASRLVTNAEYREFIGDGGYTTTTLWLSDGWATIQREGWKQPIYWSQDCEQEFTLAGVRQLDPAAPVCHLSYFEADAFARWAGQRLPTETEWENCAASVPVAGNLLEMQQFHPQTCAQEKDRPQQLFGDVWEWTASPYVNYPGFRAASGALGEYNGKFMCNQWVLRGGSCVTSQDHIRATYRNFFYPDSRWQFTGLRLAKDL